MFRVHRPVDEFAPRFPCKHADGTAHASTKSQPSSPHPPGAEIWTAKVLSAGMREGTAQSLASITLNSSYKQGLKNIGSAGAPLPGRQIYARKFAPKLRLISGCQAQKLKHFVGILRFDRNMTQICLIIITFRT